MKIILISGKAGHGKDTAAKMIKEELEAKGERVLTIHFGDPVKWFAREYYNWDGKKDETGRNLLQYIGTEMMRNYDDKYWGRMISEFIAANQDFTWAIIPDWRFYSEKTALLLENDIIYTIRITRFNGLIPYINPNMTEKQLKHVSETELDNTPFDFYLTNDTLENLKNNIHNLVNILTKDKK